MDEDEQEHVPKPMSEGEKTENEIEREKELEAIKKNIQWFKDTTEAIRNGNLARLAKLIKNKVKKTDKSGRTVLHEAVTHGKKEIVSYLLKKGADVMQVTHKGFTALHVAALENQSDIACTLLKEVNEDVLLELIDAKTFTNEKTALDIAIKKEFHELAKILEDTRASIQVDDEPKYCLSDGIYHVLFEFENNQNWWHPSTIDYYDHQAWLENNAELCEYENEFESEITEESADEDEVVDTLDLREECDNIQSLLSSPRRNREIFSLDASETDELNELLDAAEKLYAEVKIWIGRLVEPTGKISNSREGSHILNCALELVEAFEVYESQSLEEVHGDLNIEILKKTLEVLQFDRESDFTVTDNQQFESKGQSARYYRLLTSTDKSEHLIFVEFANDLIKEPFRAFIKSIHASKILDAVKRGDIPYVTQNYWRVKNKQPPRLMDVDGRAPLHIAALRNDERMVETLLKQGAYVRFATATSRSTALHIAAAKGHTSIVKILLQRDNSSEFVDAKTYQKNSTALHAAARNNNAAIVKILLAYGATYCVRDTTGKTPLDLASDEEIVNFLKLIGELFDMAKDGNTAVGVKLKKLQRDGLLAVGNARNDNGQTLIGMAEDKGHASIAREVKRLVVRMDKIKNRVSKRK